MIKYDDIWIPLQNGLSTYTGIQVIQAESVGKQPPYPFFSIKKTTIAQGVGQAVNRIIGTTATIEQDVESVFSITCNAATIEDAEDYTQKARAYFLGRGHIELSDKNITVVDVLNATNRDVFLTVDYERRCGFDLRLRVRGQESYETEIIEKVTIN